MHPPAVFPLIGLDRGGKVFHTGVVGTQARLGIALPSASGGCAMPLRASAEARP
jgi:hypothetical protein